MIKPTTRWGLGLVAFALNVGCWIGSPPTSPHGHRTLKPAELPFLSLPAMPRLVARRNIILSRFDTVSANPVGGLYDHVDYSISPLQRTYFYRDGAVEIFEHVSDGLRGSGLRVMKDYGGVVSPALIEPPWRDTKPVLVRATVVALQHDQIRDPSGDVEAAYLRVRIGAYEANGTKIFERELEVAGQVKPESAEMLKLLGWKLAEKLVRDPEFVRAIGGAS